MKIAIDARVLMAGKYSGVSWYAYNLINSLLMIDQENEYLLFINSSKQLELPEFKAPNVSYKRFNYPNKLFNLSLNFFGWPKLDHLVGDCEVFLAPNLHFVSWSINCRKVIIIHDLSFLAYPDFFNFKQRLWHKLILNKKILQQADVIIADSISTKNDLIGLLNIPAEKIKVVYLGGGDQLVIDSATALQKFTLPEKYFLFVGTIEPRKNLIGVVQALIRLPADVKLVVVGDWGWKNQTERRLMANNKRVINLGYVSEIEKLALYSQAVALVYASFYEGFGLPIVEAMASGCPVIAGNNSSQGEVLGDAGLLVDPFNVTEISQAMELMLVDLDLRQEFIKRGKIQAGQFTWDKTARATLEILKSLKIYENRH